MILTPLALSPVSTFASAEVFVVTVKASVSWTYPGLTTPVIPIPAATPPVTAVPSVTVTVVPDTLSARAPELPVTPREPKV